MIIEFLGAAHEVTGSCHYMEVAGTHILVDCGMQQGPDLYENQELPVNPATIDYVLVTHAHIDHSGLLPLLYNHGFRGNIYATEATTALCNIMLKDSAHIQQTEAEWKNRKARRANRPEVVPMYDMNDAEGVLEHFIPCSYNKKIKIDDNVSIRFIDAGHLLGSSSIEVWLKDDKEEIKLAFSGDLGNGGRPLIKNPDFIKDADYVIIESTYGDRVHNTPPDYAIELAKIMRTTFARGGNLVIPAFSVGRSQEMLYYMRRIKSENLLPEFADFEVYVDSPMSVQATHVFGENTKDCYNEEAIDLLNKGINPIGFEGLKTSVTSDESRNINFISKPIVIISASGMCEAGRIRHHLKHNLWRRECTILFVGYQVEGTLGNQLLAGVKEVKLFGETIDVNASIVNLPGISGHADINHLTDWMRHFENKPRRVFVVHGHDEVTDNFAQHLHAELGLDAIAPYSGDTFDLSTNLCIAQGSREIAKKPAPRKESSNIFARLVAAGERLMAVIRKNEGLANKDLGKFADQINALSDKWDR